MNYFIFSTFVLSLSLITQVKAQTGVAIGARTTALGSTSSTFCDPLSAVNNPAGMAFLKQSSLAFSFDDRFLFMELSVKTAAGTLVTKKGSFGLSTIQQGNRAFNHLSAGLSYARRLGTHISFGVRCRIDRTKLSEGYGQRITPGADIGLLMNLKENLAFGVIVYNPARPILSLTYRERRPAVFRTGLSYRFSSSLRLMTEVSKQTSLPMQIHTGIECRITQYCSARAGFSAFPFRYSFGSCFSFKKWEIDIATAYHETLGFSPSTSISYLF